MLQISNLSIYYGKSVALRSVTLEVREKEIVSLLGANGAGKSTTLRTISGLLTPRSGEITFMGEKISGLPPHKVVRKGISHCPEGRRIFPDLSVYENLVMMGAYLRSDKKEVMDSLESVYVLFPKLKERRYQKGGTLSGGEQQMLAIGRALMSKPKLLLLDEPSLGLAPSAVQDLARRIREIHASGVTVLLVEQNARMALGISDRAYVLEVGKITLSGEAKDLIQIDQVRKAYLGM
ncbi:MAG: ABC transporter ATP-binding protein [Deltaproteobacteria bacterium RBG_13_53_10]|nr:MAG: ABC transporter ATP-binding protein [Deltaproteobacteria bacterium RBG_13_53_10]